MPEDRIPAAANAGEGFEGALYSYRLLGHSNQHSKGAAGEFLTIPAMAHRSAGRVGLGCVPHCAAEAATLNLDVGPPCSLTLSAQGRTRLPIHSGLPVTK